MALNVYFGRDANSREGGKKLKWRFPTNSNKKPTVYVAYTFTRYRSIK